MSAQPDTPARRDNVEQVYKRVREAILTGEISAGTAMSQVALADELRVSRTPLREALRMLQSEGLVDSEPNRRVRVAHLSIKDVEELYTIRIPLEVTALRLSMPRMTPEDIAELEGYMAAMAHFAADDDYDRWRVPHAAFHRALTVHSGSRFDALLVQLMEHSERYRRMHFGQTFSDQATVDHREILDAAKSSDPDLASARLARHLARTVFEIVELVEPAYDLAALREVLADVAHVTGHPVEVEARVKSARKTARTGR